MAIELLAVTTGCQKRRPISFCLYWMKGVRFSRAFSALASSFLLSVFDFLVARKSCESWAFAAAIYWITSLSRSASL